MLISEQNFFDEDGVPMNLKDVLEEICKFLNWTCADWRGKVYFNDPDWTGEYLEYTPDFSSYTVVSPNELNVQANGFAGADHTLDILGGYNKVSVKTNNYNVGEVFPDEEYDSLKEDGRADYTSGSNVCHKVFLDGKVFKTYLYSRENQTETDSSDPAVKNGLFGAQIIKRSNYKIKDGVPSITNYSFENLIQIKRVHYIVSDKILVSQKVLDMGKPLLEFADKLPVAAYANGAIAINVDMQLSDNNDVISFGESLNGPDPHPFLRCILGIGNKYWNGSGWQDGQCTFDLPFEPKMISTGGNQRPVTEGGFVSCKNTKTLTMPYNGLDGYIMPLPNTPYAGDVKFKIVGFQAMFDITGVYLNCFLKDLSLKYQIKDGYNVDADSDRIYENVVNESYVNELDEIENKISTYNYDDLSYSKVLLSGDFLTDNLYSALKAGNVRLEEQLITRIINRYSQPSIKLKQILSLSDNITPITRMTDNYLSGKKFIVTGGSINIEAESFETQMVEVL